MTMEDVSSTGRSEARQMRVQKSVDDYFLSRIYHEELSKLVCLLYTDPHFEPVLTGEGFDTLPCDVPLPEELPAPHQEVLLVHKQVAVLPAGDVEYKQNFPLLFYIETGSRPGTCRLWMSSRTNALIQRNDYGLSFQESVEVYPDNKGLPRFFLNRRYMEEIFRKEIHSNLILLKGSSVDHRGFACTSSNDSYSLKKQLAFWCPSVPEQTCRFLNRRRSSKWPSQSLVQRAMEHGCYLLATKDNNDSDLDWKLCFYEFERYLFEDLSLKKKQAFSELSNILLNMKEWHVDWFLDHHLRNLFLSSLENMSEGSFEMDDIVECVTNALRQLHRFLKDGNFASFFTPDDNLLTGIDPDIVNKLERKIGHLLSHPDSLSLIELSGHSTEVKDDGLQKEMYFVRLFEQNIHLLVLQMYARLHSCTTVEQSISKHRAVLRELDRILSAEEAKKKSPAFIQFQRAVTSSLGTVYFTKAIKAYYSKEKIVFFQKAEDCLVNGSAMDCTLGRVKLANFYVKTKRFEKALVVLSSLVTDNGEAIPDKSDRDGEVSDALWQKWNCGQFAFDFMVSELEKPSHLIPVQKSLPVVYNQMLGLPRCKVSVVSPTFLAKYLYVLCCIELGCTNRTAIQIVLDQMEVTTRQDEESYLNDKRTIVYCNYLAHLYLLLKENDKAVELLKRSVSMMSNPINPATVTLFSFRVERLKKLLFQGASVVAVAGVVLALFKLRH